jgi:hypothetical protein
MDTRISKVLNNPEASPQDFFELVNMFDISSISVRDEISLMVNEFIPYDNESFFWAKGTIASCTIKNDDIKSVSGKMINEGDDLLISVEMENDSLVEICIYHTDSIKAAIPKNFVEIDVINFLDDMSELEDHTANVTVEDIFGMHLNIVDATISIMKDEERYYFLHISNEIDTSLDVPLADDGRNAIFMECKEYDGIDSFIIRPHEQPFMQVKIVITRNNQT